MNFSRAREFSGFAVVQRDLRGPAFRVHVNEFIRESKVHYYVTPLVDGAEAAR